MIRYGTEEYVFKEIQGNMQAENTQENSVVLFISLKKYLESKGYDEKIFNDIVEFVSKNEVIFAKKKKSEVKVLAHKGFASKSAEGLAKTHGYNYDDMLKRLGEIPVPKNGRKIYQKTNQIKISINDVREILLIDGKLVNK